MNYSEKYGNSIDEAVELALKDLKTTKDNVTVTVLEQPSKGFLGLGSKLAKVRVELKEEEKTAEPEIAEKTESVDISDEESTADQQETDDDTYLKENREKRHERPSGQKKKKNRNRGRSKKDINVDKATARPDDLVPVDEHPALDFLKETTKKMGLDLSFKAEKNDDNIYIDISGKDSGTVIGKRGQTLDAVQYLTSLVINKDNEKYVRVVLDAENYRNKRKRTLENLADRLAGKVARTGRTVRLEPMNPYERMIIHAALQDDERVITKSEGEEPYRRVVIELK